jgi:hypothetical protein
MYEEKGLKADHQSQVQAESQKQGWIKAGLSLAILFQLFCVCLAPNRNAYLRSRFSSFTDPYTNVMGLASTWSFFAPEPGPPPLYINYEMFDKNGVSLRTGSWPDPKDKFFFSDRALRRGAATQFILSRPDDAVNMLIPYFCHRDPTIGSVRLWTSIYGIPPMEDVADGKRAIGDDVNLQHKALGYDFCPEKAGA